MRYIKQPVKFIFISLLALLLLSVKCRETDAKLSNKIKIPVSQLLSEKKFDTLFPMRDKFYSYQAFIKAIDQLGNIKVKVTVRDGYLYQLIRTNKVTRRAVVIRQDEGWNNADAKTKPDSSYTIDYGNFCTEKDVQTNEKELAAFFAQIAHETRHGEDGTYTDGLMFIHEINTSLPYISDNDQYPASKGKKYYGRGPMQLSYNGNYGYASDCIFGNKKILLNDPDLIQTDPIVAFETAIYFWMTPQDNKPSAHDVMIGKWQPTAADKARGRIPGFGMTINIINGPVECDKGDNMPNMKDRIGYYHHFLKLLGVSDPNCACSCGYMQPY